MSTKTKKRPSKLPGNHKETIFVMADNPLAYAFMIEPIDKDLFELTTILLDKEKNRTEYVIHCDTEGLRVLQNGIAKTLYEEHLKGKC